MKWETTLRKGPTRNTTLPAPGTRARFGLAHYAWLKKKPKNLIDWDWAVKNARSCIWPVRTDWWLSFIQQLEFSVDLPMAETHQTSLVSQITIPMRLTSPRLIVCHHNITLLQFAAFCASIFSLKLTIPSRRLTSMFGWPQSVPVHESQKRK